MPELDILRGFEYQTLRITKEWQNDHLEPMQASLMIFPRVFAVGTKQKDYVTCTVDSRTYFDYDEQMESAPEDFVANSFDSRKACGKDFARYLKPLSKGDLVVKARGKEIVYAAGLHAVRVHFGLEGTMAVIPTAAFLEMVSHDCPGSNKDKKKAASMRSFVVPSYLAVDGARSGGSTRQAMAVFAALVGEEHTLVMVDHNRLLRIHIMSRSKPWTADDLTPQSESWPLLWSDNHGPDWIHEKNAAEDTLDRWRDSVLADHAPAPSVSVASSMVDTMCSNQVVFNGYGQHTAHDLLHSLGLWPGMPSYPLCANDTIYDRFKSALHEYATQYDSPLYRTRCLGVANHNSALAFNYKSDDNYHMHYLKVYRKSTVRMSREEYNCFAKQGLFNPSHTIGEPYAYEDSELIALVYRDVAVYQYSRSGKDPVYSAITAKPPTQWKYGDDDVTVLVAPDARSAGFSTTLGPASFHMYKNNQFDWTAKSKPGRKPKVHTGRPGRPPRAKPLTSTLQGRAAKGANAQSRGFTAAQTTTNVYEDLSVALGERPPKRSRRSRAEVGTSDRVTRSEFSRSAVPCAP